MALLGGPLLLGAVTSPFKRAGRPGAVLPPDRRVRPAAPAAPGPLAAYRALCGFPESGALPLTYPHVLAFGPTLRLLTRRAFPLPVLGLVHTWIEVTPHRPVDPAEPLGLTVYAEGLAPHRRGTEVTMAVEARVGDERVWESRSGYLSRHHRDPGEDDAGPPPPSGDHLPVRAEWRLPGDLGRRYGAVSGDRNPIHLHPLTARPLGFPRAIAHGMWTFARCLAEAGAPDGVRSARAVFRAPVPLPGTVAYAAGADGRSFALRGTGPEGGRRVHLVGTVVRDGDGDS